MTLARLRRLVAREHGLTLLELVIVMPMLTVLLGGLIVVLTSTMHWNSRTQEQSTLQTEARAVVGTFVADLRQAYLGNGPPIASATATSITFYSPDKQPSFHLRLISYRLASGALQRSQAASTNTYPSGPPWSFPAMSAWATQIGSVTNTDVFTYLDANGAVLPAPVADPSQIRAVTVKLTVTTGGSQPQISTYTDTAALRETE